MRKSPPRVFAVRVNFQVDQREHLVAVGQDGMRFEHNFTNGSDEREPHVEDAVAIGGAVLIVMALR